MSIQIDRAISRSAARLRIGAFAAMGVMLLVYLAARFDVQVGHAHVEYRHALDQPFAKWVADGSMVLLLIALFRLTQMLGRIACGELFSVAVIGRFRSFALWLLLMALLELIAPIALGLIGGAETLPHQIRVTLDLRDVLTVGITSLLFLLASLLERARRLEDEMGEFV